jgi:DNA-binding response OmpR family regulator
VRLLVVEDYAPLVRSLEQGLREQGYAVDVAIDGEAGFASATASTYDAIILDWMLPRLDGVSMLKALRGRGVVTPVLMLTAKDTVSDRVFGLDAGADDYLVKPFALDELFARLRALIRRGYRAADGTIRVADLEIDTVARRVSRGGESIELSGREYALLEYLAHRKGHVVTREEIAEHLYDFSKEVSSNVIDVYIGYLRKKIDKDYERKLIATRRGLGYLLGESE